jgi:hypothetical protein
MFFLLFLLDDRRIRIRTSRLTDTDLGGPKTFGSRSPALFLTMLLFFSHPLPMKKSHASSEYYEGRRKDPELSYLFFYFMPLLQTQRAESIIKATEAHSSDPSRPFNSKHSCSHWLRPPPPPPSLTS